MKVETLIESVIKQGFDEKLIHKALVDGDVKAIERFISQLNRSRVEGTRRQVLYHLFEMAARSDKEKALDILGASLNMKHQDVVGAVAQLSHFHDERAMTLIRTVFDTKWKHQAATVFVNVYYNGDAEEALLNETEVVRYAAVQQLDRQQNTAALVSALKDDSAAVKCVAAWYMGRKQVKEAVEPLIELVQAEEDTETLRAAVWSLGVLQDTQALPHVEKLRDHTNPVIAATANEAVIRLGKSQASGGLGNGS